jgi:hypothetical protein
MFRTRSKAAPAVPETTAPDVYPAEDPGFGSHALHVSDATCGRCNREIKDTDETRRKADGSYVHLCC